MVKAHMAETPAIGAAAQEMQRVIDWMDLRFRAVTEIGRALGSTLNLDELLVQVMDKVTLILQAERSSLFLVDEERGQIWSKVAQGAGKLEIRLPLGSGIAGAVAATGRAVNIQDAYADPRFNPEVDRATGYRTHSVLCVPLRGKTGRVSGVVEVLNKKQGVFTVEDENILQAIASQAGMALENAQLYSAVVGKNIELAESQVKLRQKMAELDLLYEIERDISAAMDLSKLLDAIIARAMSLSSAEAGSILLSEEDSGELFFRTALGAKGDAVKRLRVAPGQGVAGRVAETGRPMIVNDVESDRSYSPEIAQKVGFSTRNLIAVPLVHQNRIVGVLELINKTVGGFTSDDEKILTLLAGQVARAVVLARTREENERSQRLATLGHMLSGLMHDLRTPMTIISGYAQLMADEADSAERGRYTDLIVRQFDHINEMTREVLAFVRGERQVLVRKVFIDRFIEEVKEYLTRDFSGKKTELVIETELEGAARFDEAKMKRVIYNMARNAMQAMAPEGGKFILGLRREGDALVFVFADTGPGIPDEIKPLLFKSFVTHGKTEGTGLGLALCKKIIEEHGGGIQAVSHPGRGAMFIATLPGAFADGASAMPSSAPQ
jgi:signal transduction histidine kinase